MEIHAAAYLSSSRVACVTEEDRAALELLEARKRDYQQCFTSPAGQRVLVDFSNFMRAAESCGVPGDRDKTFTLIGRHECWLRIQNHLNLTTDKLFLLATGRPYIIGETDE